MAHVDAELDLLVGQLAVHNGLIGPDDLVQLGPIEGAEVDLASRLVDLGLLDLATSDALSSLARALRRRTSSAPTGGSGAAETVEWNSVVAEGSTPTEPWSRASSAEEASGPEQAGHPGGRYRIVSLLARGGLGEVYLADDTVLQRRVALKGIRSDRVVDASGRARFLHEARIAGRHEHPGIVPVHDLIGTEGGRPFYVMRYVGGQSLAQALRAFHHPEANPRPPGEHGLALRSFLAQFIDICNAISYSHSIGVIHRDVKPANVMLGQFGETQLVDWGLGKVLGQTDDGSGLSSSSSSVSGEDPELTVAGSAMGTPGYMSPEQARGDRFKIGPASDVFSLGATLYHVLTGRPPFVGADRRAVIERSKRGEFPRPRAIRPGIPAALEAICLKAMALEPKDRYRSVRELIGEVEHWLADEPVAALPDNRFQRLARWSRRHRAWTRAGAAALAVVAVVATTAALLVARANQGERQALVQANERRQAAETSLKVARQAVYETLTNLAGDTLNPFPGTLPVRRRFAATARMYMGYFLAADPDDDGLRDQAIQVYRQSGRLDGLAGDVVEARRDYDAALDLARRLVDLGPGPRFERFGLVFAEVCHDYASFLAGRGLVDQAGPIVRDGLAMVGRLREGDPSAVNYRRSQGHLERQRARVDFRSGRLDEALAGYRANADWFRALAGAGLLQGGDLWGLAFAVTGEASVLRELGKPTDADEALGEAIARLEDRDDNNSRYALAGLLANRGQGRALASDPSLRPKAEADLDRAVSVFDRLRLEHPEIVGYTREWAFARNCRGELRASDPARRDEAAADYRLALDVMGPQVAASGNSPAPDDLIELARAEAGLGRLESHGAGSAEARSRLERAAGHLKRGLKTSPADPALLRELRHVEADLQRPVR